MENSLVYNMGQIENFSKILYNNEHPFRGHKSETLFYSGQSLVWLCQVRRENFLTMSKKYWCHSVTSEKPFVAEKFW